MLIRRALLTKLVARSTSTSYDEAAFVPAGDIATALTYYLPAHIDTAGTFCKFIHNVVSMGGLAKEAVKVGVISHMFDIIVRWPSEAEMVQHACSVLLSLLTSGEPSAALAVRTFFGAQQLLQGVVESGIDEFGIAREAFKLLQLQRQVKP